MFLLFIFEILNDNDLQWTLSEVYQFGAVVAVGDPVDNVEDDEDWRRDPHRPGVDVVHQELLARGQTELDMLDRRLVQENVVQDGQKATH